MKNKKKFIYFGLILCFIATSLNIRINGESIVEKIKEYFACATPSSNIVYYEVNMFKYNFEGFNAAARNMSTSTYYSLSLEQREAIDTNYYLTGPQASSRRSTNTGVGLAETYLDNGVLYTKKRNNNGVVFFPTTQAEVNRINGLGFGTVYSNVNFGYKMGFVKQNDGYSYFNSSEMHVKLNTGTKTYELHSGAAGGRLMDAGGGWATEQKTGFFPFNNDCWALGASSYGDNAYHFGMQLTIPFYMTADGKTINYSTHQYEDMVFNFSGDDDVWVYVDGKLALDIGGEHGELGGYINFANNMSYTDVSGAATYNLFGASRLSEGYHVITVFYMERPGGDSNFKAKFNLPETTSYSGTKTWDDNSNTLNIRPSNYTLKLYRNGTYLKSQTFTTSSWEFTGLSKFDISGNLYTYTVQEDEINLANGDRYVPSISGTSVTNRLVRTPRYIVVNHIDKITGQILDTETLQGFVWDTVTTSSKSIQDYTLVESPSTENYTYTIATQTVNYYYKHNAEVDVIFIDQITEEEIEELVNIKGLEQDPYTTTPKVIDGYILVKTPSNSTGSMTVDKITVVYEYRKLSDVIVNYVDEITDELLTPETSKTYKQGDDYTTELKIFNDYVFTNITGDPSGTITSMDVYVTYYYRKVAGGVDVEYIDQVTKEKLDEYTINGLQNQEYKTESKVISGYVLVKIPDNKDGIMTLSKQTVTYEYRKITTLRVLYVDKVNGTVLSTYTTTGKEGDEYETESRTIANYSLIETPTNSNGVMNVIYNLDGTITTETVVTYYYGLISKGITVQHIDRVTGLLLEQESKTGNEGDSYTTESKTFNGYKLVETPDNASGVFGKYKELVKYYYQKITPVISEYIDELTGEKIVGDVINNNLLEGDLYTTEAKSFNGYELVRVPDNASGITKVDESGNATTIVKYYYREISGGLEVKYLDIADNRELAKAEKEGLIGDIVNTNAKVITGYVLAQKPTEEQYTLKKDKQTVIYYYKKISQGVDVKHVDKITGNLLDEDLIEGNEGDTYTTDKKTIDGYELVTIPSNATGTMTDEVTEVIYEYKKIMKLVVEYVDSKTGEKLDGYEEKKLEGDTYKTESKLIDGYIYSRVEYEEEGTMYVEHNRSTGEEIIIKKVVYYYVKEAGNLVVNYIDKDTDELLEKLTLTGYIGDEIGLEEKDFEDYLLVDSPKISKVNLTVEDIEVSYYYAKKDGTVTVRYIDKDTGKELLEADVITDKVGVKYVTERREIQNYRAYGEEPENKTGAIKEEQLEVVYYYEKIPGKIIIISKDFDTREILAEETIDGYVGEAISKMLADIEGYELLSERTIKVAFIDGEIVIEVFYKKIPEITPNTADMEGVKGLLVIAALSLVLGTTIIAKKALLDK